METETTPNPTNDELIQQLTDIQNVEQAKAQQLQMQGEQMQKQLQQVIATKASTLGQITELKQTTRELERNQHQIEGALNTLQAMLG